jgi:hypothetical protein
MKARLIAYVPRRSAAIWIRERSLQSCVAAGGGLLLSLSLPSDIGRAQPAAGDAFTPNAFIRIGGVGRIVLTMPYVEMGQGTYSSIPMPLAEELEVALDQVELEHEEEAEAFAEETPTLAYIPIKAHARRCLELEVKPPEPPREVGSGSDPLYACVLAGRDRKTQRHSLTKAIPFA